MTEKLVGIRAAAREIGVSHSTLSRQVRGGQVRSHAGLVRVSEILQDRAANVEQAPWQGRRASAGQKAPGASEAVHAPKTGGAPVRGVRHAPVATSEEAEAAVGLIRAVLQAEGVIPAEGKAIDFNLTRMAGEILKARERDLRVKERKRELVPLASVKAHVERAFIGLRQAIQRMPSRHAAAMAAELGCDAGALDAAMAKAIAAELDVLSSPVVR